MKTTHTLSEAFVARQRSRLDRKPLAGVERALNKIERGTYGICEGSGKPIPQDRLVAQPEAVTTIEEAGAAS